MSPIMANSKDGKNHKDKYFDTSRKFFSQEMTMCNMEALLSIFKVMTFLKHWSNVKVKRLSTNRKILSQEIFMRNIKALTLAIQMLSTRLKYSKSRPESKFKVTSSHSPFHKILRSTMKR